MAAMKKGTKLTDTPKDYMLRVRMDKQTLDMLDKVCENKGLSRSETVRNGIEEMYRRIKK
ncbi:MAG: CopG family transcriptional regulator [bacterium]|nr:CopG family transcriptional regulator [bacterium]